jgi:hypothetical protein
MSWVEAIGDLAACGFLMRSFRVFCTGAKEPRIFVAQSFVYNRVVRKRRPTPYVPNPSTFLPRGESMTRVNLYLPDALWKRLQYLSEKTADSASSHVRQALVAYLNKLERVSK